jgi:hypothetical protein
LQVTALDVFGVKLLLENLDLGIENVVVLLPLGLDGAFEFGGALFVLAQLTLNIQQRGLEAL